MTLAACVVQRGRNGNGLQWQRCEEQGISLCFAKIAVCDADYEVKMKDLLWYGVFYYFFKYIYTYGRIRSERDRGELLAGGFGQTED